MSLRRLFSPLLVLCSAAVLGGCSDRQDLLASTSPPEAGAGVAGAGGADSASVGASAGRAGNGGDGNGGDGTAASGGKKAEQAGGAAGAANEPPKPSVYPQGCPPNAPHPSITEEIIACGLPPGIDLAAIDEDGLVFFNVDQGHLRRLDRASGVVSLLREEPLGGAWDPDRHGPSRNGLLHLVDVADARLFTVDQRTGKAKTLGYGTSLRNLVLGPDHIYAQLQDGVNFSSHGPIGRFAYGASSSFGTKVSKSYAAPVAVDGGFVYFEHSSKRIVRRVPLAGAANMEADVFTLPPIATGSKHGRAPWTVRDGQLYFVEDAGPFGTHVVARRSVDAAATDASTPLVTFVDDGCDCAPQSLRAAEGFLLVPAFGNVTAIPLAQPALARQIFPRTLTRLGILVDATHFYAVGNRGGVDAPLEGFIGRVARDTIVPFVP